MGKVGIGTDAPDPSSALHVAGKLKVDDNIVLNGHWLSGDGENEGVHVNPAGNVGIGTVLPLAKLHVAGEGRFDQGVSHLAPLGDVSMGIYTNGP